MLNQLLRLQPTTKRQARTAVLLLALLLCLGIGTFNTPRAHADPSNLIYTIQAYCLKVIPPKAIEGCNDIDNINHAANVASHHCTSQPVAGNQKADCIVAKAKAYIKRVADSTPTPAAASTFTNRLDNILSAAGGSPTTPSHDAVPILTTSSGDPAACVADPTLAGCSSDANAFCGPDNCDLIKRYVNPTIDVLSVIFGLVAAASIILGGIQYSSSAGDPQKVTAAKHRITQTLIAILAYAFLFAFLQFLIPGGLF